MPRKTKKQKQLAHTRASQLPKRENVIIHKQTSVEQTISPSLSTVGTKKEQLPLIPHHTSSKVIEHVETDATSYFRHDIQKTAFLTGMIVVIEVVLYQLMQNGTLARLIPALKL